MALALIPLLIAEQGAGTAWALAGRTLGGLIRKSPPERLLLLIYHDYDEQIPLKKSAFAALTEDAELRPELESVLHGRLSRDHPEELAAFASLLERRLARRG